MAETVTFQGGRVIEAASFAHNEKTCTPGVVSSALLVLKPGIATGVSVAGLAGMALAAGALPEPETAVLSVGCILSAAMGSAAFNVIAESGTDVSMKRLARRNVALARLGAGPVGALALFLVAASLSVSYIYLNPLTAYLILAASLSYTLVYTLYSKKSSPYGTVTGGIPGALPVLIGYASVRPELGFDAAILFVLMLLWQPPHFLSLALKYSDDFERAGIPAMPSVLGERYTKAFMLIYATALVPVVLALWLFGYCSGWFAVAGVSATALYIVLGSREIYLTGRYGRAFMYSILYIMAVLSMVVIDAGLSGGSTTAPLIAMF